MAGDVVGRYGRVPNVASDAARLGHPGDPPGAACFFASDEAGYITGQALSACGGLTMAGQPER